MTAHEIIIILTGIIAILLVMMWQWSAHKIGFFDWLIHWRETYISEKNKKRREKNNRKAEKQRKKEKKAKQSRWKKLTRKTKFYYFYCLFFVVLIGIRIPPNQYINFTDTMILFSLGAILLLFLEAIMDPYSNVSNKKTIKAILDDVPKIHRTKISGAIENKSNDVIANEK